MLKNEKRVENDHAREHISINPSNCVKLIYTNKNGVNLWFSEKNVSILFTLSNSNTLRPKKP